MDEFRLVRQLGDSRELLPGSYNTLEEAQAARDRELLQDADIQRLADREPEIPHGDDGNEFRLRYLTEGRPDITPLDQWSYVIVCRNVTPWRRVD